MSHWLSSDIGAVDADADQFLWHRGGSDFK
jgi:hypothetical protein